MTCCFELNMTNICNSTDYRLLLLDEHSSHISANFITHCLLHHIVLLYLPPHSTHLIQPLDLGIFNQYQHHYGNLVDERMRLMTASLMKADFINLITTA